MTVHMTEGVRAAARAPSAHSEKGTNPARQNLAARRAGSVKTALRCTPSPTTQEAPVTERCQSPKTRRPW